MGACLQVCTWGTMLSCWLVVLQCYAQGTVHITFDGPPMQPPGTAYYIQQYSEGGILFTPMAWSEGFGRRGENPRDGWPDNGSAYLQASLGDSLQFVFLDGSVFDLISVDLAEWSSALPEAVTVQFVGHRYDGSTVSTILTSDGVFDGEGPLADFETLYFDPKEWTGLIRVEVPTDIWALDNVVVFVPEPSGVSLLMVGAAIIWASRRRNRTR